MGPMRILATAVALLGAACATSPGPPIPEGATVRRLATDMGFTEGPVWLEDQEAVVFSDIPNARLMRWSEADGLSEFRERENANGNALDPDRRLLSCQHGARNIVREEADGSLAVIVDRFMGNRFNSPNDLAVQSDGVL
ncbi:MAG: SMP-30/gluconolactonase/LRE family protein, partial [Planctomycetota bacterium]